MDLENFLYPDKIAVVGASRHEGKTGHEIFDNLIHGFDGEVVPVNPHADEVEGIEAYDKVPEDVDLAVVSVPAKFVPDVIRDCGEKEVDSAVVISAGFSETGNEALQSEVEYLADQNNVKILGPNVLGIINTENSMNASFASKMPEKGDMSFMSQSGAFCTAMLDYSKPENIGFNHFISLGNEMMIDEIDFLKYWRKEETDVILSYVESIENGREFIEEAEKTSREKPVVMIKSGRTESGGEAASSHTGSIAGSIDAYRAAFRKTGIIEAESNRELLDFGKFFSFQPLPEGKNIAVVTNAGGPGVISADEVFERGMEMAYFTDQTVEELTENLPEEASKDNPVDIVGDAGHRRYHDAIRAVLEDEEVDALIVVLTPQANTQIEKTAHTVVSLVEETDKTVCGCFMGEEDVEKGRQILERNEVPVVDDPKQAVKSIKAMSDYREFRGIEYSYKEVKKSKKASEAIDNYSGFSSAKRILDEYGFNTALTKSVDTPREAIETASKIGYPVTLKLDSTDLSHKTELGGVKTDLRNRKEIQNAFQSIVEEAFTGLDTEVSIQVQEQLEGLEVALGLKRDPQFGPVVMVGLGGIYVEAFKDVSFGVAPISEEEADQMIHELRSSPIFEGMRGQDYSLESLKDAIITLGEIGLNHEKIENIDINPLMLREDSAIAVDIDFQLND